MDVRPCSNRHGFGLRAAHLFAWPSLLASLLSVLAAFGNGKLDRMVLFSSDAMFVPVFVRDVLVRRTFAGWDLPTNPYFLPDLLLFSLFDLVVDNVRWAAALYGVTQLLLLIVGMSLLHHMVLGSARLAQILALHTLGLFMLLVSTGQHGFQHLAVMGLHHFGIVVLIPFGLGALIQISSTDAAPVQRRWATFGLLVLVGLASLSDSLFIVQFVVPVLVASLGLAWFTGTLTRHLALLHSGVLLAAASGQWARQILVPPDKLRLYAQRADVDGILNSLQAVSTWANGALTVNPLLTGFWVSSTLALIATLLIAGARWGRIRNQAAIDQADLPRLMLVCAVVLGSIGTSFGVAILSGNFEEGVTARYLLPAIVLPLLTGWPFLIALVRPITHPRILQGISLALCLPSLLLIGYVLWGKPLAGVAAVGSYQDPLVACLEREAAQRGLTRGLAGYWEATSSMALSEGRLSFLQVEPHLSPYYWNNNRAWYDEPFDFVLIHPEAKPEYRILPETVIQRLGTPSDTFECGGSTIFTYSQTGDARTRHLLRGSYALADLTQVGAEMVLPGYTLPSRIGGVPIGLSQAASDHWGNKEGDLVFVPLVQRAQMPAGHYAVEFHVYADSERTGSWEVVRSPNEQPVRLLGGEVALAGPSILSGTLSLPERTDVELRVLYAGNGTLFVDQIRLKRLGQPAEATPAAAPEPLPASEGVLALVYPENGAFIADRIVDFVWEWTGPALAPDQAFEVRLWQEHNSFHYGAHDARVSAQSVRQVRDTYIVRLDLNGAYGMMQHGPGDYLWSVGIVATEPAYQDLGIEAPPRLLHLLP